MSKNRRIKSEEKIKIAQKCIEGKISITEVSKQMGVGKTTVQEWIAKYQAEGSLGFLNHEMNRVYSAELKAQVVEEYLSGTGSLLELCKKYQIRSKTQLRDWIKVYNSGKDFNKHKMSGGSRMKKTRKTTHEERIIMLTLLSVHCADRITAMSRWKGVS